MPGDHSVSVYDTVNQIGELESTLTYNLSELEINDAAGLKINEVNFQPLKNLLIITIQNFYKEDFQTVNLGIFENLDNIEKLSLKDNKISKVENTANGCILPNLDELDLNANELTTLDLVVLRCSENLKELDLSSNQIETIEDSSPDGTCMLPNLKQLILSNNQLKHFEPSLFSCSRNLTTLRIDLNQLITFGEKPVTCYWPHLDDLNLNANQIENFIEEFLKCTPKISNLQLSGNKLKSFGAIRRKSRCVTPKLHILNVANNEIATFNFIQFHCSKSLAFVNLEDNKLSMLPANLNRENFPILTFFDFYRNPWKCPHIEKIVTSLDEMEINYVKDEECSGKSVGGICCK